MKVLYHNHKLGNQCLYEIGLNRWHEITALRELFQTIYILYYNTIYAPKLILTNYYEKYK